MPDPATHRTAKHRLLIVEDEPAVCELLSDIVASQGVEPVCVQSDRAAHQALRSGDFSCMIVDVNLGHGTTGFDVARYARRIAPKIGVMYVSGQSSEASVDTYGVTGSLFLAKPFTAQELLDRLSILNGDNDD